MDIKIKRFSYFRRPIINTTPLKDVSIAEVAEIIMNDEQLRITTETFRKNPDGEKKKQMFDFVTFGGTFSKRSEKELIELSGYICLDFDKVADLPTFKIGITNDQDFQPVLVFTSPSGAGLKVVYAIDETVGSFAYIYTEISKALARKYGVTADPIAKSPATPCFLAHDPNCSFNEDASVVIVAPEPPTLNMHAPSILKHAADLDKVKKVVEMLEKGSINIIKSHNDMVSIGYSLANLGGDGRELFNRVCVLGGHYTDTQKNNEKFDYLMQNNRGQISLGTFFHACKQAGLDIQIPVEVPTLTKRLTELEGFLTDRYQFQFNEITGRVQLKNG